jgi:hypothetical protein
VALFHFFLPLNVLSITSLQKYKEERDKGWLSGQRLIKRKLSGEANLMNATKKRKNDWHSSNGWLTPDNKKCKQWHALLSPS